MLPVAQTGRLPPVSVKKLPPAVVTFGEREGPAGLLDAVRGTRSFDTG